MSHIVRDSTGLNFFTPIKIDPRLTSSFSRDQAPSDLLLKSLEEQRVFVRRFTKPGREELYYYIRTKLKGLNLLILAPLLLVVAYGSIKIK